MVKTIGNPLSWGGNAVAAAGAHVASTTTALGGDAAVPEPRVRKLTLADLGEALRRGYADFMELRTDVIALCLLYPLIGVVLSWITLNRSLLPILFPVMAGFALLGPVAAVGLYQMSRRRERGEKTGWFDAFGVIAAPSFGAIFLLGLGLLLIFALWLVAAHVIFLVTLGPENPTSIAAFMHDVLATGPGWEMIALGFGTGFVFAAVVLSISVVSFPLLLDRRVGLPVAVITSVRLAAKNPLPVAVWGLIVALALALGTIPVFLGLIVVLPILGHATWHLYRRAVA